MQNSDHLGSSGRTAENLAEKPRYVVQKASGSEWARVVDTATGLQIAKYSVLPRKRSTRDGWADAERHARRLNAVLA